VIEVGVGPNTPVVTRIPACAFASALAAGGGSPVYLRINPDPPEGPRQGPATGVPFFRWRQPWTALEPLVEGAVALRRAVEPPPSPWPGEEEGAAGGAAADADAEREYWQDEYRGLLQSLRRPPSVSF